LADQADKLRGLRLVSGGAPADGKAQSSRRGRQEDAVHEARPAIPARPRVRSIALTSGKGGVGKTSIATNLAIAFARQGRRVLLVDGDLSLANVDVLLGVVPQKNLGDVIFGGASIEQVVLKTVDGVLLLPSASGVGELADLDDFRRERLLRELARLEDSVELILLDTGSGIGRQTIHFARAADDVVVVTTPEPTAFSDAYATLKVLSQGRLHGRPGIVVNMAATPEEGRETERRIRLVAERFLHLKPDYLGHIALDPSVGRAVRQQQPLLTAFPRSPAAAGIEALAARLLVEPPCPEPSEVDPDGFFLKMANFDG
jgi:flagellar biosynthesis protein FlhG